MAESLHPQEGVRFLLELRSVDGTTARYRAAIYTPDAVFEYQAVLEQGGEAALSGAGAPAPAALEQKLLAHARQAARAADRKAAEALPPWPHRVLRWRGPGRG